MKTHKRGSVSSPALPFLNLQTDDRRKHLHHEALAQLLSIFRAAGMNHYNVSHIDDPERDPELPIKIGKHLYDLSFPKDKNTIILIELKILRLPVTPAQEPPNGKSNNKIPPE